MNWGESNPPRPPDRADENKQVCPYLGLRDDPQLRYSFPETLNCCHRVRRPQRVALDHQGEVCLAGTYQTACPVYSTDWKGPLPKELRGLEHQARSSWATAGLVISGLALVIIMAVVFVYFKWPAGLARFAGNDQTTPTEGPVSLSESTRSVTPVSLFSATPAATLTQVLPSPTISPAPQGTATPSQTATLGTPTPGPLENTPFGPNGRYVVHKVKDGEMMETIATLYHTSPTVLKAINGLKPEAGFWPGQMAVLAIGETDPNNVFPMQAVWLAQPMRVDVLAAKYATSVDELRSFNGLGPGDTVPGGRWIVARKQ
jgi:LysM repeat protein